MKKILLTLLFATVGLVSFAATITSTGDGDWEDDDSWDLGRVPTDGDIIVIETGETITVTTNNTDCNGAPATHVYIKGTLTFTNGAKLNLGCGSSITVEPGGTIDGGSGGGSSKKIIICGSTVWDSGDPDVLGPASFGTPLPISLTSLDVELYNDNHVLIEWVTASEDNNDYFEVLRSQNGLTYEPIGRVDGAGTTAQMMIYEYIDENPLQGTSYYKLRQTDYDGQFEEFGPKVINFFTEADGTCVLKVYPNPCPGNCRANLSECPQGTPELRLMMTDATGNVISEQYDTRDFNGSFDIKIDKSSNMKPGIYIISAVSGDAKFSEKVIVQ